MTIQAYMYNITDSPNWGNGHASLLSNWKMQRCKWRVGCATPELNRSKANGERVPLANPTSIRPVIFVSISFNNPIAASVPHHCYATFILLCYAPSLKISVFGARCCYLITIVFFINTCNYKTQINNIWNSKC